MSIEDWQRPQHSATSARALVHFVVFGDLPTGLTLAARHRVGPMPAGLVVTRVERGRRGYVAPPEIESVRELSDRTALLAAERCDAQIVVRAELDDRSDLAELRTVIGVTTAIAEHPEARAVLDTQIFRLRTATAWRADVFEPDAPRVDAHVLIMQSESESESGIWLHTRGLRKFARPDLSMNGIAAGRIETAIEIIGRFVALSIAGGVIADGSEVRVRGWPNGWRCHHRGDLDDPDFNNTHVAIAPAPGTKRAGRPRRRR